MGTQRLTALRNIRKGDSGNFTIEASMVFPVIFLITIALLFVSLFFYQKSILYSIAAITANRAAFTWDNSYKNQLTGGYYIADNDPLYWRTFNDSLSDMFDFAIPNDPVKVRIPEDKNQDSKKVSLPRKKLLHTAILIPTGMSGELSYRHTLLERKIDLKLRTPFKMPNILLLGASGDVVSAEASAWVADPVEFIRNLDFLQNYWPAVADGLDLNHVKEMFNHSQPVNEQTANVELAFDKEAEAQVYLRNRVLGEKGKIDTKPVDQSRQIDAMDQDGIVHQALLGYISRDKKKRREIAKDIELMRTGQVQGVVWHFYKSKKTGKIGPSKPLARDLEKAGIVVVIHGQ